MNNSFLSISAVFLGLFCFGCATSSGYPSSRSFDSRYATTNFDQMNSETIKNAPNELWRGIDSVPDSTIEQITIRPYTVFLAMLTAGLKASDEYGTTDDTRKVLVDFTNAYVNNRTCFELRSRSENPIAFEDQPIYIYAQDTEKKLYRLALVESAYSEGKEYISGYSNTTTTYNYNPITKTNTPTYSTSSSPGYYNHFKTQDVVFCTDAKIDLTRAFNILIFASSEKVTPYRIKTLSWYPKGQKLSLTNYDEELVASIKADLAHDPSFKYDRRNINSKVAETLVTLLKTHDYETIIQKIKAFRNPLTNSDLLTLGDLAVIESKQDEKCDNNFIENISMLGGYTATDIKDSFQTKCPAMNMLYFKHNPPIRAKILIETHNELISEIKYKLDSVDENNLLIRWVRSELAMHNTFKELCKKKNNNADEKECILTNKIISEAKSIDNLVSERLKIKRGLNKENIQKLNQFLEEVRKYE